MSFLATEDNMKKTNQQNKNIQSDKEKNHYTPQKEKPAANQQTTENVGYPDISKANTKIIVIASLVCILIILILSILFPSSEKDQTTTEATTENEITANKDAKTGFTTINNKTYYYPDDENIHTGWYMINDTAIVYSPNEFISYVS